MKVDVTTGALAGLRVKPGDWEALAGPANVVARETDNGDFWELYHNLDGGQNVMMTRPLNVPQPGQARFSNEEAAKSGTDRPRPRRPLSAGPNPQNVPDAAVPSVRARKRS